MTKAASASNKHLCKRLWCAAVVGIADVYFTVCEIYPAILEKHWPSCSVFSIQDSLAVVPDQLKMKFESFSSLFSL